MTEIQIKNLIKEYEKEYIEFMEIEKLPQYKIDFFEINVEESDAAGFASAAQAYYNTKTYIKDMQKFGNTKVYCVS